MLPTTYIFVVHENVCWVLQHTFSWRDNENISTFWLKEGSYLEPCLISKSIAMFFYRLWRRVKEVGGILG